MKTIQTLSIFCLSPLLAAQQASTAAAFVPADSSVVLEFAGLEQCRTAWSTHGLGELLNTTLEQLDAEQRSVLFEPWENEIAPQLNRLLEEIDLSPATVRGLLQGPVVLAVGRPTFGGGVLMPSVALVLDVSGATRSAERAVSRLEAVVPQIGRGRGSVEHETVAGVDTRVVHPGEPGVGDFFLGATSGRLILSNSRGYFRACVSVIERQAPSAASTPAYAAARRQLPGDPLGSVWINTGPLMATLQPFLPYEADEIGELLGVGGLHGVYLAAGTDGASGTEVLHIALPGEQTGLFRAGFSGSVNLDVTKYCDPETLAFLALKVDPAAFYQALTALVDQLPQWVPEEGRREITRAVAEIEQAAGQLMILSGDIAVAANAQRLVPIPEITAFIGLADTEGADGHLRELLAQISEGDVSSQSFMDTEIFTVPVQIEQVNLAPSFAIHDGMLIVSTFPQVLKSVLRRGGKQARQFSQHPAMGGIQAQAGDSNGVLYFGAGEIASLLLDTPLQQQLRVEIQRLDINPDVVPEPEDMASALGSLLVSLRVDEEGLTVTSRSAAGQGTALALAGYLVDRALRYLIDKDV